MYISRVYLDPCREETIRLVRSPYRIHAAVERAFSSAREKEDGTGRILWRLDVSPRRDRLALYIVSPSRPNLTHMAKQVGCPAAGEGLTKDYAPVLDRISEGQIWAFRLKANPARKVSKDRGVVANEQVVGTIQGHVTEAQQVDWLLSRSEAHGFEVPRLEGRLQVDVSQRYKERFARDGKTVTIATARFDGLLTVTNSDLFRQALCRGIGRAKGFGCGLMTIAPPPDAARCDEMMA